MPKTIICTECGETELTEEEIVYSKSLFKDNQYMCYYCILDSWKKVTDDLPEHMTPSKPVPERFGRDSNEVALEIKARKLKRKEDGTTSSDDVEGILDHIHGSSDNNDKPCPMEPQPPLPTEDKPYTVLRHEASPGNYYEFSINYPLSKELKESIQIALKTYWIDTFRTICMGGVDNNTLITMLKQNKVGFF